MNFQTTNEYFYGGSVMNAEPYRSKFGTYASKPLWRREGVQH